MIFQNKSLFFRITITLVSLCLSGVLYLWPHSPANQMLLSLVSIGRTGLLMFAITMLLCGFKKLTLPSKILIGLVLGALLGILLGPAIQEIKPIGDAFIRLISLIVVPLVFASLLLGTASLNDIRKLGRIGVKTLGYYLITTSVAIVIGLILANTIQPGKFVDQKAQTELLKNYSQQADKKINSANNKPSTIDTLLNIIPKNPINAMANGNMLQIIFFALAFGVALTLIDKNKATPVIAFFDGVNDAMIYIVNLVMVTAPYAVFALIANIVGFYGIGILKTLLSYSLVVVLGLCIHAIIFLPLVLKLFTPMGFSQFFRGIRPAQLIAFSSSSSSATLPVTIKCVEENLKVSPKVASFVLPLGATINMDGTALYQGVAAVFIAQVYGLDLGLAEQLTILLTATLASVGAAGVPGMGMITLALVLQSINIPLEGIALILGVDRILDMCRTAVNVTGDASATVIVAASEQELNIKSIDLEAQNQSICE